MLDVSGWLSDSYRVAVPGSHKCVIQPCYLGRRGERKGLPVRTLFLRNERADYPVLTQNKYSGSPLGIVCCFRMMWSGFVRHDSSDEAITDGIVHSNTPTIGL